MKEEEKEGMREGERGDVLERKKKKQTVQERGKANECEEKRWRGRRNGGRKSKRENPKRARTDLASMQEER